MSIVVFLGPSLPRSDAEALLTADYRPPVALGDVYRATRERPACIAIIDGVFHHQPAVWHKEIVHALAQGIGVVGCSSMGALRAAELFPCGMAGTGRIFELYRRGVIEADDEVAVTHGDATSGYRGSSVALVNIRVALLELTALGMLTSDEASTLLAALGRVHYALRSWPQVLEQLGSTLGPERTTAISAWLSEHRPDQKRDDAKELLVRLANGEFLGDGRPRMPFERTFHWDRMTAEEDAAPAPTEAFDLGNAR